MDVQHRPIDEMVRKSNKIVVEQDTRTRGSLNGHRLKLKKGYAFHSAIEDMSPNRVEWMKMNSSIRLQKFGIHVLLLLFFIIYLCAFWAK